jgi:hypothetical protein
MTRKPAAGATPKKAAKPARPSIASQPKVVRGSFTMTEGDFAVIAALKSRALGAKRAAKKSELVRAGLRVLGALDAKALVAALDKLEAIKTGRPRKGH